MKIYIDDVRQEPDGWVRCYWPDEVLQLCELAHVEAVSLDHDLGDDERGTGYDVLRTLEEWAHSDDEEVRDRVPPTLKVHSANVAARARMESAIAAIQRQLG